MISVRYETLKCAKDVWRVGCGGAVAGCMCWVCAFADVDIWCEAGWLGGR